jgi:hypothetical protein
MEDCVLQNVVINQPSGPGVWDFYPEYWGSSVLLLRLYCFLMLELTVTS